MSETLAIFIASPLEEDLVDRIRKEVRGVEVFHDPDLLPTPRYPSDHRGDPSFARTPEQDDTFWAAAERAVVAFGTPGESPAGLHELVDRAPHLRWVQGTAAGMGQQVHAADLTPEQLERVRFTSSVGVHAEQLAEWAVLGLLTFTKDLPRQLRDKAARRWDHYPVRELLGQRLLVVGLGHIGREVARDAMALGMQVTGVRRHPDAPDNGVVTDVRSLDDLPDLVQTADAVVLALPGTPATDGLFSRDLIDALPRHAIVVNVGRGTTVDEPALVDALKEGRLAGAALDVFATEPLPPDSPLWDLENVIISPHTVALSTRENERIVDLFIDNLRRFIAGDDLRNQVDTVHFY